ncbi:MAG: hypothetical protein EZS28_000602 [Streblomastix strix]|uniref:Uncharacterized protein n=1 Tax=Streblomastix strix TaxID=222440 RepID=A0A5J4X995_9EUKA|nr:MAG: hypothetical protein EZS28_000602 [Streblomastix strix]
MLHKHFVRLFGKDRPELQLNSYEEGSAFITELARYGHISLDERDKYIEQFNRMHYPVNYKELKVGMSWAGQETDGEIDSLLSSTGERARRMAEQIQESMDNISTGGQFYSLPNSALLLAGELRRGEKQISDVIKNLARVAGPYGYGRYNEEEECVDNLFWKRLSAKPALQPVSLNLLKFFREQRSIAQHFSGYIVPAFEGSYGKNGSSLESITLSQTEIDVYKQNDQLEGSLKAVTTRDILARIDPQRLSLYIPLRQCESARVENCVAALGWGLCEERYKQNPVDVLLYSRWPKNSLDLNRAEELGIAQKYVNLSSPAFPSQCISPPYTNEQSIYASNSLSLSFSIFLETVRVHKQFYQFGEEWLKSILQEKQSENKKSDTQREYLRQIRLNKIYEEQDDEMKKRVQNRKKREQQEEMMKKNPPSKQSDSESDSELKQKRSSNFGRKDIFEQYNEMNEGIISIDPQIRIFILACIGSVGNFDDQIKDKLKERGNAQQGEKDKSQEDVEIKDKKQSEEDEADEEDMWADSEEGTGFFQKIINIKKEKQTDKKLFPSFLDVLRHPLMAGHTSEKELQECWESILTRVSESHRLERV